MKFTLLFMLLLLIAPSRASAQEHSPQLLYASETELFLLDTATGVTTSLPNISGGNRYYSPWRWSPDGTYLFGIVRDTEAGTTSIQFYDVDQQEYWEDAPVILAASPTYITNAEWSPDGKKISYSINVSEDTGQLWVLDLRTREQTLIHQSEDIKHAYLGTGVREQWWSPSGEYLLFVDFSELIGGADFNLYLTDLSDEPAFLYGRYYANYNPIWSPDNQWFLLRLRDTYYAGPATQVDDRGDVYLYSSVDGTQYPITATPDVEEANLRWSEDGREIQYESEETLVTVAFQDVLAQNGELPVRIEPIPYTRPPLGVKQCNSPDGSLIAFLYPNTGRYNLWIVDSERKNFQKVSEVESYNYLLCWRP